MAGDGNGEKPKDPIDISVRRAREKRRERRDVQGHPPAKVEWDMDFRRAKVMELRLQGFTTGPGIAAELKRVYQIDACEQTCRNDLLVIDAQLVAEAKVDRETEKGRQLAQVRGMIKAIFKKALMGDLYTIDRMVALLKLEASIIGTEAPKEIRFNPIEVARKVALDEGLDEAEVLAIAEEIANAAREAGTG